jgi:hypothetical protein
MATLGAGPQRGVRDSLRGSTLALTQANAIAHIAQEEELEKETVGAIPFACVRFSMSIANIGNCHWIIQYWILSKEDCLRPI